MLEEREVKEVNVRWRRRCCDIWRSDLKSCRIADSTCLTGRSARQEAAFNAVKSVVESRELEYEGERETEKRVTEKVKRRK